MTTHAETKTLLFTSYRSVRTGLSGSRIQNEKPINGAVAREKIVFLLVLPGNENGWRTHDPA
jgi:hypothetical protein